MNRRVFAVYPNSFRNSSKKGKHKRHEGKAFILPCCQALKMVEDKMKR
jgi:hypothetical protein